MPDSLFDVSGEVAVITGVSGQLGMEYAREFLRRDSYVAGLDLSMSTGVEALCVEYPNHFKFYQGDVTKKEDMLDILGEVTSQLGSPTILINNAGLDSPPSAPAEDTGPFESYPQASWDKVLDVNLKGVFLCCQVFGSKMAQQGCGSIVNVASIYGVVAPDQQLYQYRRDEGDLFFKPVAYSASKSGVVNLTRYLAAYWGRKNVRVNSLTIAGVFNNQDQKFLDGYCGRIPIGRMADSSEYNGAVIFLSAPASRYMTGHNMVVDGGWTAI